MTTQIDVCGYCGGDVDVVDFFGEYVCECCGEPPPTRQANLAPASHGISAVIQGAMHAPSTEVENMSTKQILTTITVYTDGTTTNTGQTTAANLPPVPGPTLRSDVPTKFLKLGDQREEVGQLQRALKALGHEVMIGRGDGARFGEVTEACVRAFQAQHPEVGTPDGKYGKKTQAALSKALNDAGIAVFRA